MIICFGTFFLRVDDNEKSNQENTYRCYEHWKNLLNEKG